MPRQPGSARDRVVRRTLELDWQVLPHGDLVPLAENLWRVEGELPKMELRRCMTVARTSGGELALHSAIAMDEAHMAELEALGTPTFLIVPNGWHCLDAARYKARYPDLKVICPKQARKLVERKVQSVSGTYEDFATLDAEGAPPRARRLRGRSRRPPACRGRRPAPAR